MSQANTATDPFRERLNVALLASNQALFLIAAITVMTLSGVVGRDLAPSPVLATLPVALMMLGTVTVTLPASLLMKRIGRRAGFLIGTIGGGVGGGAVSALGVMTGSFLLFCLGNLLLGLYQAFAMYYRFAAADAASESFRSRAISLVLAGGVVAAFLGPWNANYGQAVLAAAPQAGPYVIVTALSALAAVLVGLLRIPSAAEPKGGPQRSMREIAARPRFPVALTSAAIGYAVMILVMTATPLAMRDAGFEMAQAALVMQWHVLGMFAPSFFTGSLIARFGVRRILGAGGIILLISAATAISGQTLVHFWVALVALGVGWNFLFIGGSTMLTALHTPDERGKVQGINDLVIFGLVALGSFMAGTLLHQFGWAGLNIAVTPFVLLALAAVAWLSLRERTTETVPKA